MSPGIHPTAIIDKTAEIADGVEIGPYAYVGPHVQIASGVKIGHGATIDRLTSIGPDTQIWPQAAVGMAPQDLKYAGEDSRLEIGARCMIREFASLHRGTKGGGMLTRIGDDVLIMNGAHVGHDAKVGNRCIIAAQSALGGHVELGDHAIIGGITAVHQWVRIGAHAMIAAGILVNQDVPTYGVIKGEDEHIAGVNITGLKRRGFNRQTIQNISAAMKLLFLERDELPLATALAQAKAKFADDAAVTELLDFVEASGGQNRKRGFASAR